MATYDFHPLANLFPLIEGAEFDDLVADIREHGQREEVVLWQGKVLDGRNRYRACLVAQIEPRFSHFRPEQGDALAYVVSRNLKRRHLNESQRAMVAADIETYRHGDNQHKGGDANLHVLRSEAAKMTTVSTRLVASAAVVRDKAEPELRQAVRAGKLSVSAAADAAQLPATRQRAVVEHAEKGNPNAARTVIKQARREEREAALGEQQAAGNLTLPQKKYGVILADPEWRFEPRSRETGLDRAADNHYPTSPTEVIASRPVREFAAPDCTLFLWATAPMIEAALAVMKAWGFFYKSQAVWLKENIITGYWFRGQHELLLVGTRGSVPAPAMGTQFASILRGLSGRHSAKPDCQYEVIEQYFPNLPKIELNARSGRPGWDSWGFDATPETRGVVSSAPAGGRQEPQPGTGPAPQRAAGDGLDIPESLRRKSPAVANG